jgi:hypothetical protein
MAKRHGGRCIRACRLPQVLAGPACRNTEAYSRVHEPSINSHRIGATRSAELPSCRERSTASMLSRSYATLSVPVLENCHVGRRRRMGVHNRRIVVFQKLGSVSVEVWREEERWARSR